MFRDDTELPSATTPTPAPEVVAPADLGLPVEPRRLLRALSQSRRSIFAATMLAAVVGAAIGKFVVPKSYLAHATLLWQPPATAHADAAREVATVAQSVKVPANLLRMRERLHLPTPIDRLAQNLDVTPGESSHLIAVSAHASSADEAARLAQGLVDVFLEAQRDQAQAKLQEIATALHQSLAQATDAQTRSRARYNDFRSEHHIDDFPTDVQHSISEAARLRVAAGDAEVDLRGLEARLMALRGSRSASSEQVVLSRSEHNDDRSRLGQQESELAGLRARFTDEHPRVRAAAAEVDALRERVGGGVNPTVVGQVVGRNPLRDALAMQVEESTALRKAVAERARALAELRRAAEERAERLTQAQGEAARLLAEVQANEEHVTLLHKQIAMAEDDVRAATSGFQVLSRALPPERSEKGWGRLVAILAPLVVLVVTALMALWRELRAGAVRGSSEVAYWLQAPVLWASSWPSAGSPAVLARELADALENRPAVVGLVGIGAASSAEVASLISARLRSRSCPVSVWDAREAGVTDENAPLEACEERRVGQALQARISQGRVVLVTGLDDANPEQLRGMSRWLDALLVVVSSGTARAAELRSLRRSLPRLAGRMAAVVIDAPDGLGHPEISGPTWLRVATARPVQPDPTARRRVPPNAPQGVAPCKSPASTR